MENIEGKKAPLCTLRVRRAGQWVDVSTDTIFAGRRIVVFALPGAFTPTCSSTHVPRYNELALAFKEAGIDEIVCIAVNDPFVMEEWQRRQNAEHLTFLPDGNACFSRAMGAVVDKRDLGLGERSWRYSMLVDDGIIEKMFIEPDEPGDPFHVSDADTMLEHISPGAAKPPRVTLFTKEGCPHCARAKGRLKELGWRYEEILIGNALTVATLENVTGQKTVPQVYIDGEHVGTADDFEAWLAKKPQFATVGNRSEAH